MLKNGLFNLALVPMRLLFCLSRRKMGHGSFALTKLNDLIVKNKFPFPIIDGLLAKLHGDMIFSKIDLKLGYHQIRMKPQDVQKTPSNMVQGLWFNRSKPFKPGPKPRASIGASNFI